MSTFRCRLVGAAWDPKYRRYGFVAELADQPVAMAACEEWPWWYEPGRYVLYIEVMPAFRRQGMGGQTL